MLFGLVVTGCCRFLSLRIHESFNDVVRFCSVLVYF